MIIDMTDDRRLRGQFAKEPQIYLLMNHFDFFILLEGFFHNAGKKFVIDMYRQIQTEIFAELERYSNDIEGVNSFGTSQTNLFFSRWSNSLLGEHHQRSSETAVGERLFIRLDFHVLFPGQRS